MNTNELASPTASQDLTVPPPTLATRWQALQDAKPQQRIRDAATELGVSEAQLVETLVGTTATRLDSEPGKLVHALVDVGRCMALTRNESAVSETKGTYGGVELGGHAGQVIGHGVDLRVFLAHWKHSFAITEPHPQQAGALRKSLHVFDASGTAVHKVYLQPEANEAAWDAMVAARTVIDAPLLLVEPAPAKRPERPDAEVEVEAMLAAWDAMQDTHEFFPLLMTHRVSRLQALRLAGPTRARQVSKDSLDTIVRAAAETGEKIMIFVGNRGCIQVFSGPVKKILRSGPWFNVMDPDFNLHLREDHVASSWVVQKPTRAGVVSSLELYDAAGENITLLFRKRDDRDRAEDPQWSDRLDALPSAGSV